jgi:hypothetical protein
MAHDYTGAITSCSDVSSSPESTKPMLPSFLQKSVLTSLFLLAVVTVPVAAVAQKIPAHGTPVDLFNGHDLSKFDTFIQGKALNSDPDRIFTVDKGLIHISGQGFGYIITRDSYKDFCLTADFRWGDGTFMERKGKARDSGILFNVQGEQKVWPRSIEFQITEGGTGDFWMTDGAALTGIARDGKAGERVTGPAGSAVSIPRYNKGKAPNVTGVRDPTGEVEKPHGQWNHLVLISQSGHIKQFVNGKLANEGTDPFPAEGKILFQSEGAEIFYRNLKLYPLK